jgi:hypothetical protein
MFLQRLTSVNRLLEVLGRMNRQLAVLFFQNFLPWKYDDTAMIFTSKIKGETKINNKMAAIAAFLATEDNNIWTWQRDNVAPVERKVNFDQNITNLLKRALDPDNKDHIDTKTALNAVVSVITLDDVLSYVTDALEVKKAEEAKLAEEAKKLAEAQAKPEPKAAKAEKPKVLKAA